MQRLLKRRDFLAARDGRKAHSGTLTLQALARDPTNEARVGFTVTKKTGNSVKRNRIRRRLREAVRQAAPLAAHDGHDYVVIGRPAALQAPFATILNELTSAFRRVHAARQGGRHERPRGGEAGR